MDRRTFSAALAAPVFAATAKRIGVAVIGTGHGHAISKIRALRSMPEYEFKGVCAHGDEPRRHEALAGVEWIDLRRMLDDPQVELAAVESADVNANLEYAERCVSAGKFVHLDKPPGADLGRLRALLEEAARRKRVVQMGYQWRYHPAFQALMEAARKGWLGRVYRFSASIDKLILEEERRHLAQFRGGMMFSEGCHLVDCAVSVLGKPRRATGFLRHDSPVDDGLADNTLAILEYERAFADIHIAGFHPRGAAHRYVEIRGSNGSARLQPYTFPSRLTVDLAEAAGPYKAGTNAAELQAPPGPGYTPDFREMARIIREGASPTYLAGHDLDTQETLLRVCGMLGQPI